MEEIELLRLSASNGTTESSRTELSNQQDGHPGFSMCIEDARPNPDRRGIPVPL